MRGGAVNSIISETRKAGREVDFAIVRDGVLDELLEVKYSDPEVSRHLKYYVKKLKPAKATQIVANLKNPFDRDGIRVTGPLEYFADPPWKQTVVGAQ